MIGLRRHWRRAPLILGALALVLGAVVALEMWAPTERHSVAAAVAVRTPEVGSRTPARFALPPLARYAEVTARPLFSETRRPPLESASSGDAQSAAFVLIGIVISPDARYALIAHGRPLHTERTSVGQELDGWTVQQILPDRVLFQRGDRSLELKPRDATPPARDIQPAPSHPGVPRR